MTSPTPIAPTPPDWAWIHLEQAALAFDCPHSTPKLAQDGPFLARTQDISTGVFRREGAARVSRATYEGRVARATPEYGDLLYSREGTYFGVAAEVPPGTEVCLGQRMVLIRPDPMVLHHSYARYWLDSNPMRSYVNAHKDGSVAQRLNLPIIRSIPVPLPSLAEQRGIAATLGALDDKIESNRHIVDLVPRLIRAVIAEALDDEGREIAVADLATFVNGGAYTKGASGKGRIVIRIAELNSGLGASTVYNEIDVPEEKTARPGDLLMSWSGSLAVYRWVLGESIINQHIFKVLPSRGYPAWLVFDRLDQVMPVFQGIAKDKATTMGHIQRGHLESTAVEVPNREGIRNLDSQIAPLWDRLLLAEQETVKLTALRDTLVPELLSGRIRVPEADLAAAEALA